MNDNLSIARAELLHPIAKQLFTDFIEECERTFNITLRIMQGYRTFAQQQALYAQGRTQPGSIVTNAQEGQSAHNYGLAIDLCHMVEGVVDWSFDMSKLQPIAQKYGGVWGGSWVHMVDRPHFEIMFGYSWEQLLALHNAGKVDSAGYVLINRQTTSNDAV